MSNGRALFVPPHLDSNPCEFSRNFFWEKSWKISASRLLNQTKSMTAVTAVKVVFSGASGAQSSSSWRFGGPAGNFPYEASFHRPFPLNWGGSLRQTHFGDSLVRRAGSGVLTVVRRSLILFFRLPGDFLSAPRGDCIVGRGFSAACVEEVTAVLLA